VTNLFNHSDEFQSNGTVNAINNGINFTLGNSVATTVHDCVGVGSKVTKFVFKYEVICVLK
jgi:hypothetical protein